MPSTVPPASPDGELIVNDADFSRECERHALPMHGDGKIVTAVLSRSKDWGLVWRADILEYHTPDPALEAELKATSEKLGVPYEPTSAGPHLWRAVVWRSSQGFIVMNYGTDEEPLN